MTGVANTSCRKLSENEIIEIRTKLAMGLAERKIAAEYMVAKTTIHSIKTGECYSAKSSSMSRREDLNLRSALIPNQVA